MYTYASCVLVLNHISDFHTLQENLMWILYIPPYIRISINTFSQLIKSHPPFPLPTHNRSKSILGCSTSHIVMIFLVFPVRLISFSFYMPFLIPYLNTATGHVLIPWILFLLFSLNLKIFLILPGLGGLVGTCCHDFVNTFLTTHCIAMKFGESS